MAKKKSFVNAPGMNDDPALSFISQESIQRAAPGPAAAPAPSPAARPEVPEGLRRSPEYIEVKSRRVQLVMQPSLYSRVKRESQRAGLSFNEFCRQALEKAVKG